jgi:hypothetical protein
MSKVETRSKTQGQFDSPRNEANHFAIHCFMIDASLTDLQHSLQESVMAALCFHYLLRATRAVSSACGVDRDHTFCLAFPPV